MILDILHDSFIYETDSDTCIPYIDLVNVPVTGHKDFRLNFDFNINVSSVYVGLSTYSGVTASGHYGEINDLGYPCAHYSFSDCLDQVNPNYVDINFDNHGITQTSGVVCSGMLCNGSSYLLSEPYFLYGCSYTSLLYFKQILHVTGTTHDNLFFRTEGTENEILGIGTTQSGNLSLMLYNGTSEELFDTGLPTISGSWNLLSLRCSPKTKLRVGCNGEFVEVNRPCAFLGGSSVTYLGGKSGVGYFNGVLSDFTWWPNYADNIFIENAITYPAIALNGQRRPAATTVTSSGVFFNLLERYPSQIHLEFDFPAENMITGMGVYTYGEKYLLASGIDTLFCGTVVRGHTSTDYPIELYNNTNYETYGYVFAYDSNRYKALSVSSDAENYYSNQVSLPGDVPWGAGEFCTGINNEIIIDTPYNTSINSANSIVLHNNSRKCLWYLSKDVFGFYDLRTGIFYNRTYPYAVSETSIANDKHYWEFGSDDNYLYFIYYKNGVYKYNAITDTWSLLHSIPPCDNVCISVSEDYVFYVYYESGASSVFRYTLSNGDVDTVCGFSSSNVKIESNRDVLFTFNGNTIFKYDVDTLDIISVSQHIGLSNVLEVKDICGYLLIITTSAVYSLSYSQDDWGVLLKVYDFSSSFSISTVSRCTQYIAFVKSNNVYLSRVSHYRYLDTEVNILNNYNNTLSILPKAVANRYKVVWMWLDADEKVPTFHITSKLSMDEKVIYGFTRDTTPTAGTMSVFMSFNFVTKKYTMLDSVVANNLIDVDGGCLVETHDVVYYINFSKQHYYKYVVASGTLGDWSQLSSPKTYSSVSSCSITSAVYDLDKKIWLAGESKGGYSTQSYNDVRDRHYSFFGYIDIDTDIIHNMYYLPVIVVEGLQNNGQDLTQGGSSFTCDLSYNLNNDYLFLAVSQYTSRAQCYMFDASVTSPSGVYVYDSLEDLYDGGCIIYSPFVGSRYNNLMNNYYFNTNYYAGLGSSDVTGRGCLYFNTNSNYSSKYFNWGGGSVGSKTNYEFSIHTRVLVPNYTTYMPVLLDNVGRDGFEVGFDNNDIIACCRKGDDHLTMSYPMASVGASGIAKGDWVDLGASLYCDGDTHISLYVNGQNIMTSSGTAACCNYNSSATFHPIYTVGSPYMNNSSTFYYNSTGARITELSVFDRVLSDTEFSGISYSASGKLLARAEMDYNILNDIRLPQSDYEVGDPPSYYFDGVDRAYSIQDYTANYMYYLSNYTIIEVNTTTLDAVCSNLRSAYNSDCDYNFLTPTIKNCFTETSMNVIAAQSAYGIVYVGAAVFDTSTKYYDTGAFVSPVIDVGDTGIIAYNFEYSLVRDAYLEFYMRYANDKPVDFCHVYYVDASNNYIESSLATGKAFYTGSVSHPKSCNVYYDDTTIKITKDGNVYKSTDYTTPTDVFSLVDYTLANVSSTWFSYNGSYILYYTSDKYLVGFPLSLGLPCMRSSVTYSSVNNVAWSKYSQSIYVSVDAGVYIYNYMLGETEYIANAHRVFYIYDGPVVIKSNDNSVLLNKDGTYYNYTVDDIDFSKNIDFDYVTEWIYYVTLDKNLKRMRFIQSGGDYILEYLDTGITDVNDIYKITYDYVVLIVDARLTSYTKNGFIAVSDYPIPFMYSGDIVFFDYNPTNKTSYYNLNYLSNNDLIWSDLLDWVPLGSKSSGFVVGKRYVQLKAVFKTSSNKNATPILSRVYFGSPVRVGPLLPHAAKDFYVRLDVPLDDQGDIYSVKLIALAEDIVR